MLKPYIYGLPCKLANYIFINVKTSYRSAQWHDDRILMVIIYKFSGKLQDLIYDGSITIRMSKTKIAFLIIYVDLYKLGHMTNTNIFYECSSY